MVDTNKMVDSPVATNQEPDLTTKDYIYCEDCKMMVDFWKYDHNIEDAGHDGCNWRYVTKEELRECIEDCMEMGCFAEEMI